MREALLGDPTAQDKTFEPGPGKVFVFGSNEAGHHGAGAAATAHHEYGAILGQGVGHMGATTRASCYAIPTKDHHLQRLTLRQIASYVDEFLRYARNHPEYQFFVTRIGCGLAGFRDEDMAPLFRNAPTNCEMPHGWRQAEESR